MTARNLSGNLVMAEAQPERSDVRVESKAARDNSRI